MTETTGRAPQPTTDPYHRAPYAAGPARPAPPGYGAPQPTRPDGHWQPQNLGPQQQQQPQHQQPQNQGPQEHWQRQEQWQPDRRPQPEPWSHQDRRHPVPGPPPRPQRPGLPGHLGGPPTPPAWPPHPGTAQSQAGARPHHTEPAPARPARRGRWIAVTVLLLALGGLGWYFVQSAPTAAASAAVGDCVARSGQDDVRILGCGEPDAQFRVVGRLEDRTMIDAGLFACSDFPDATSSFWQGRSGPSELGMVLCLATVTPVTPAAT